MTIVGRFGTGNIPALTRIPFRVPLISETSESDAQWVGEGKGKPLTKFGVGRTELTPLKIATIAVQTMELIRDSSPSSDVLVRNSLAKAIAKRTDLSFIDPSSAASAGVRPGSVLNGVAATANSTATGADGVREDVQAIIGAFVAANNPLQSGVWVMSATYALRLMMMLNPLGQREFPGITMQGGTFFELPVIVSNYLGDYVALVNAEDIWFADEGGVDVAMSTEASLEMVDNPTQDSGAETPVDSEMVSMFQTNSVAFRAERTLNWARRRSSAVAWMDNITWSDPAEESAGV
jgi:HK97 family phage major capsid protein